MVDGYEETLEFDEIYEVEEEKDGFYHLNINGIKIIVMAERFEEI